MANIRKAMQMSFLSKETIKNRIDDFLPDEENFPEELYQPSSVELRLGEEAFISGSNELVQLGSGKDGHVTIRPGDFSMLLTKEKVRIPNDLMGFISIKTRFKFMGLVNISGFHVDPGFEGKLVFSIYNAGPSEIILRYDEPMFILFFAKLDHPTDDYGGSHAGQDKVPTDAMNRLLGKSISPRDLEDRLKQLETKVTFQWSLLAAAATGLILLAMKVIL